MGTCYTLVLLSIALLAIFPMYVDTGVNAIYARMTDISTRMNSMVLMDRVLPVVPTNVTGEPLDPRVAALVKSTPSSGSTQTNSVFSPKVSTFQIG